MICMTLTHPPLSLLQIVTQYADYHHVMRAYSRIEEQDASNIAYSCKI